MTKLNLAKALYLGTHKADKIYSGANLVWPLVFPFTPILDNFNRANESPVDPTHWFAGFDQDGAGYKLASNQMMPALTNWGSSAWNALCSGDMEAYVDLITFDASAANSSEVDLWAALQGPLNTSVAGNGYQMQAINKVRTPAGAAWNLNRIVGGAATHLATATTDVFHSGDSIGIRVLGGVVSGWRKPSGGAWKQLASVADATFSGGYVGLESSPQTSPPIFDNFGGGAIT